MDVRKLEVWSDSVGSRGLSGFFCCVVRC